LLPAAEPESPKKSPAFRRFAESRGSLEEIKVQ